MIDAMLSIGCAFDWISPTLTFMQDFFYGPTSDFGIPADAGWSRAELKPLLNRYGVRVWGVMYNLNGNLLMFTVRRSQAKWAYYRLQQEGVPILYAPSEATESGIGAKAGDPIDAIA